LKPVAFLDGRVNLFAGDCLEVLAGLPENSVDSVCTDPPYHLTSIVKRFGSENAVPAQVGKTGAYARATAGFMGKKWDGGDIAFRVETWAAVLRVMKPGAHLLAFSGTRTYHRMVCAIEDAGFEIRDQIAWLYGSGFPKSHDVSKGIDRMAGAERGVLYQVMRTGKEAGTYGAMTGNNVITAPATDAARQWQGWGSALKPALEPIVLARRPLTGTIASNVLRWGTGALNIDACRIGVDVTGQRPYEIQSWEQEQSLCDSCAALADVNAKHPTPEIVAFTATKPVEQTLNARGNSSQDDTGSADIGCYDGTKAENTCTSLNTSKSGKTPTDPFRLDLKSTTETRTKETTTSAICCSCQKPITGNSTSGSTTTATKTLPLGGNRPAPIGRDGEQSAHRRYTENGSTNFAATPGPRGGSPAGRWPANLLHDGSEEVLEAFPETGAGQIGGINDPNGSFGYHGGAGGLSLPGVSDAGGSAARYFYSAKADSSDRIGSKHPTVKPLDLMQYLVRLITPPGGTCLDCFAGTGTTGEAAWREGFNAILIEREEEYQADIARRMDLAVKPAKRSAVAKTKGKLMGAEGTPLFGDAA
jgi:DNA modification methylase